MFFILLFTHLAVASVSNQTWRAGSLEITLTQSPDRGLINPSCLTKSCLATQAIKNKQLGIPAELGSNPGSKICTETHKGVVVIARRHHATQALCRFSDGSYASLDGLFQ